MADKEEKNWQVGMKVSLGPVDDSPIVRLTKEYSFGFFYERLSDGQTGWCGRKVLNRIGIPV